MNFLYYNIFFAALEQFNILKLTSFSFSTLSFTKISFSFLFLTNNGFGIELILLFLVLSTLVPVLLTVAIFTVSERKVLASVQRRRGPNVVGFWGILQAIADGIKLVIKETIIPSRSSPIFFIFAPMWVFITSFTGWAIIPFYYDNFFTDLEYSILYILVISSLGVYGIILAGWGSNSRYAFLGGLRSVAQLISYEVSLGLILLPIILATNSLNFCEIILVQEKTIWFALPFFPLFIIFFITILAETNRTPFDLPEAEAELVAGFNVEYASTIFALFFLGEYSSIILMSTFLVILFLGGWNPCIFFFAPILEFVIKIVFVCFFFILVRGALPRYRYDQLMSIGWKTFLPVTLVFFFFSSTFLIWSNSFSYNETVLVNYFLKIYESEYIFENEFIN